MDHQDHGAWKESKGNQEKGVHLEEQVLLELLAHQDKKDPEDKLVRQVHR